jgi:Uma2 family endonuclease
MSVVAEGLLSEEEYLKLEEKSKDRHEYIDGTVRAMAGTTQEHNDIVQNFVLKLTPLARQQQCRLAVENIRVKLPVGSRKRYYYPDVIVTCKSNNGDRHTIENSCFIAEILSDSTAIIDKNEKLETYQRIASIQQYVLVDQSRHKVETYTRHDKVWIYQMLEEGSFEVACLHTTMTLDDVYSGLDFTVNA